MNRIAPLFRHFLHLLAHSLGTLFGNLSWQPPRWLSATGERMQSRSRLWISTGATLLALALIGTAFTAWLSSRPKADCVVVTLAVPPVSPIIDGKIEPQVLTVKFSQSAALLDQIGKKVVRGVELQPDLPGTWTWANDRELVFKPTRDWPAQTRFTVRLESSLFPGHVLLDNYRPRFTTAAFQASLDALEFYVNPKDPNVRQVTAMLTFTHPVDAAVLQRLLELKWQGKDDLFVYPFKGAPLYTVTLGDANRTAYVRSLPVRLPERDAFLNLILKPGLRNVTGEGVFNSEMRRDIRVPNLYSALEFKNVTTTIAQRTDGEPEQVLVLESTLGIKAAALRQSLSVFLLPQDKPARGKVKAVKDYDWSGAGEIDDATLAQSKPLDAKPNVTEEEFSTVHSLKISAPENRYVLVKVRHGLTGIGGFVLRDDAQTITKVVPFPKELRILHDGAILALSGERKLSILARSLRQVEYRIGRIDPKEINHLVSQSSGNFQSPVFRDYHFGEDNLCEILTKKANVTAEPGKAGYLSLNFNDYLTDKRTGEHRGLFIIRVAEVKPALSDSSEESETNDNQNEDNGSRWEDRTGEEGLVSDRRLILVTDLGIVAKQNADSSQEVFVQSIRTGQPVSDAKVEVLGKNGIPIATATTNSDGHAVLPVLKDFKREQEPVALVVRRSEDFSFMPYGRADRRLNFSRYDISGLELARPDVLDAFLFSDRGIYRPGDTARFGMVLKQMDWKGELAGLPLEIAITDPRGRESTVEQVKAPAGGFFEWKYSTKEAAPTGSYTVGLYLLKNDKRGDLLGSTTIRVEEFLPDRMKIKASLTKETGAGWVRPEELKIAVELQNLYGAPSVGHRVAGKMSLTPAEIAFKEYADYSFFDPLLKEATKRDAHDEDLADATTDDSGHATLDLNLSRFDSSAYRLTYLARGFEKEGGRSVATGGTALVSARPWLVGFKADGDLNYIARNGKRTVELIAIDPQLKLFSAGDLKLVVNEQYFVSVLTKKANGNFAYQSARREREVKTETFHLDDAPRKWEPATTQPGDFIARIFDANNLCVSVIRYTVVGSGNLTRQLERNAELKAQLVKNEFQPGEEISVAITAPYTGSGLITIERDRVYAQSWFTAKSLSSVQKITIPKDFEGNGYLNVAFVRALDSREIFMSPLSYAVIPFRVSREKRTVKVELSVPEKSAPGATLPIRFQSNKPAKIIVYAVDEGILQVAGYELPHPLDHFLQKRALQVTTDQILDLILPEYSISRDVAAAGGDGREDLLAANLNPFKRKGEAPVVFWSGIIDCGTAPREVTYRIPDYFNGTLRVMAVAVSDSAAGATEKKLTVRGPFVIQPNVPTFVAPGDTFDVSVTVANNVDGSGAGAVVDLDLSTSDSLEIVQRPALPLHIDEGRDAAVHFRCRAKDKLGNADLVFTAKHGAISTRYASNLSVRPPVAYRTEITSGIFRGTNQEIELKRNLYPDYFKGSASVSRLPYGLSRGLLTYLDEYPHLCSEQLTSRGLPLIVLAGESELGVSKAQATEGFREICGILRGRQNDEGAFGLWRADKVSPFNFTSVYVMQMLTEAQDRDYPVMADMVQEGLAYLDKMARETPQELWQARNQALAIYLLTRHGIVATNYLDRLRDHLERQHPNEWKQDLAAVYCAGAYAQLRNVREGERLLAEFKMGKLCANGEYDFYTDLGRSAQYLAILARHFPEQLRRIDNEALQSIIDPIVAGEFTTHSAAYAILGLHAYGQAASGGHLPIAAKSGRGDFQSLTTTGELAPRAALNVAMNAVRFTQESTSSSGKQTTAFYQVTQSGFEHTPPTKAVAQGLEVQREFRNTRGEVVTHAQLGEELEVHLKLRAIDRVYIENIALVDLLPGGFEVAIDSVRAAENGIVKNAESLRWKLFDVDSVDAREDRIVVYGTATRAAREFVYRIKAVNCGQYTVPPAQAESMYHRELWSRSLGSQITVEEKP